MLPYLLKIKMQCLPTLGKVDRRYTLSQLLHARDRLWECCTCEEDCLLSVPEETLEIKKQTGLGGGYMYMYVARWEAGEGGRLGYVNGWSGVSVSSSFSLGAGVCVTRSDM